jgi:hypothetical protein
MARTIIPHHSKIITAIRRARVQPHHSTSLVPYTNYIYKKVRRCEVIFYKDNQKNRCIAYATELFFEEVLMKKNE